MSSYTDTVTISWHEGDDKALTSVKSKDSVLKEFFEIQGWQNIHEMSKCVATHTNYENADEGFAFKQEGQVEVYTQTGETLIDELTFISLMLYLFELLIAGANDNHHTIRYEPWWQAYVEFMYQIQDQIK